jgi:hypothetical protein
MTEISFAMLCGVGAYRKLALLALGSDSQEEG